MRRLASKLNGTLILEDTPTALRFRAEQLPDTSYVRDFRAALANGAARYGVQPLYRLPPADVVPNATSLVPELDNPAGVDIEIVHEATLTALAIVPRPPRGNPGVVARRRRVWL